jgi:hypothetical protein
MEQPYDPALSLLGTCPKQSESAHNGDALTSMFIMVKFTIGKLWNHHRCPSRNEQIKKMWCMFTIE